MEGTGSGATFINPTYFVAGTGNFKCQQLIMQHRFMGWEVQVLTGLMVTTGVVA
jgi:hypothetical protein